MLVLVNKRLGNRLIKRLQIIADLAKFLFNIVDTVLRDPFYREYGRAVFLFDADDDITAAHIVDIVCKRANRMKYRFRIPVGLELHPRRFNDSPIDQIAYIYGYSHVICLLI